jgi:hypothetical protein
VSSSSTKSATEKRERTFSGCRDKKIEKYPSLETRGAVKNRQVVRSDAALGRGRTLASTVVMYAGYFSWTLDTTGVP